MSVTRGTDAIDGPCNDLLRNLFRNVLLCNFSSILILVLVENVDYVRANFHNAHNKRLALFYYSSLAFQMASP